MREIARDLGRSPATISREVARNRGGRGYRHRQAQDRATQRRREASGVPRKMTPDRWQAVEARLREGWSPEQIEGRYRLEGEAMAYHHSTLDFANQICQTGWHANSNQTSFP